MNAGSPKDTPSGVAQDVANRREVRRSVEKAPNLPVAGTSIVSAMNEKVQADPLVPDDVIALHAVDLCSKHSPFARVLPKNPAEVWDVFASQWISVFGKPRTIRVDGNWEGGNEVWADFFSE